MSAPRADELESTLIEVGTLLVRLEKYRFEMHPQATSLRAAAIELGGRARRLHRHGALGGREADALLLDAVHTRDELTRLVTTIHGGPDYRAAVAAHRCRDAAALADLWPRIFSGVEPGPVPLLAYHPVDWQRRGRPRPPADIAAWVEGQLRDGFEATGDDLGPGADPSLPVVSLSLHWPDGAPLAVRFAGRDLPAPVLHRPEAGEVLLPRERLQGPALVELAHESMDVDEWVGDLGAFHASIVPALRAAGVAVVAGTMPAAPE